MLPENDVEERSACEVEVLNGARDFIQKAQAVEVQTIKCEETSHFLSKASLASSSVKRSQTI